MVQKMITEFLTSTLFLLKRLAPIYILSKIYVSNVMFLFQKMLTTELVELFIKSCVTFIIRYTHVENLRSHDFLKQKHNITHVNFTQNINRSKSLE